MVKVECSGCSSPYQVDERRIPPAGLKMRCPKCGTSILVTKPDTSPRQANVATSQPGARSQNPSAHPLDDNDLPLIAPDAGFPAVIGNRTTKPRSPANVADSIELPARPVPKPEGRSTKTVGFGEIDLMVDLPELDQNAAASDIPAARKSGRTLSFGEVDLPLVEPPPPPSSKRTLAFGDAFLDETDEPELPGELPLPRRNTSTAAYGAFGELDLSLEDTDDGLPAIAADLPASVRDVTDVPSPAMATGLPAVSKHGHGSDLPTPMARGQGVGLPKPADAFPKTADVFPKPTDPFPRTADALPKSLSLEPTVPSPAGAGTIVGAELFADPSHAYDDSRVAADFQTVPRPLPPVAPVPDDAGEELSFDEAPQQAPTETAPSTYDPSDRSQNFTPLTITDRPIELEEPRASNPSIGDEVDLSGAGTEIGDLSADIAVPVDKAAQPPEVATRKPKIKRYVGAAIAIAAVVGGSLALVPDIGAFGVNFISDQLNASTHDEALEELRLRAHNELGQDTAAASARALAATKLAIQQAPRHRPTAAYSAFIAFSRSLRFGLRNVDETYGKEMLAFASSNPGDLFALATAAQDAISGQLPRARQSAQALAARRPNDIDVAVLAAEIELKAKDPAKAIEAWKHAIQIQSNARTLFGLARAQLDMNDNLAAEISAKAALKAFPNHVGARILLASIIWQTLVREQEAIDLLSKITDDAEVRASASDAELVEAYTLLGTLHLNRSRMTAAEQAFGAALKLDPQAVQALIGNGELFFRSGRYSEALARFEAAVRAHADSIPAKIGAAKTWLAQERMKEAKDLLKKLRETRPTDPQVAYWLGRTELALGNKKEAEAAYMDAVKSPENSSHVVDAYVALAALLGSLGRTDEATSKLAEATAKWPDLPALHKAKGEVALQSGRYEEAKTEFELALSKEDDLSTRFKLGVAFRRMRVFDEATRIFDKVAAQDKDYPGLALERGLLFEETGQSERALEMYADALRKAPNDLDLKLRVGSTQVMAGHAAQAEPILRDVLKDRPNSAEANHFLGRALLVRATNLAEALRFLERAAEIDPNRAEYHLYVGWAANDAGQPARADASLKRALELDQELGDAYWQRGVLLQKQGATLDALNDLQLALEKRPSRYEAYATMALCYQDQGHWADAENAWRRAIAGNDRVPEWHYRLGKIYANHGNQANSAVELDKAVTLAEAPDRPTPSWIFDAHFLLAEAMRAANNREKAIHHYKRFLETAPSDNAYRPDAQQALQNLGAGKPH